MKALGTVLPTAETIRLDNQYAARVAREKEIVASKKLAGLDRRVVGGEVRYYDTCDQYAIVTRQGRVAWFAVTPTGDFRIFTD